MQQPFSETQFFDVMTAYNHAVWPMQWILYAVAVGILGSLALRPPVRDRIVSAGLAFLWAWMAIAYHFVWFATINPAAWLFGSLYLIHVALLLWLGVIRRRLRFGLPGRERLTIALLLVLYGLVVYPLLGQWLGHSYPRLPTFGLPCPTTIFTIGIYFLLLPPFPRGILVVPIFWSLVGGSAAFLLHVWQDLGLFVAGAAALILFFWPQRSSTAMQPDPLHAG
ncbi:MAG: hypothetical protein GF330_10355 [Candidatus Eisenbacteria bacterium]|nr:hypothetical protein [Candidatus Eisenbacteria bacterium]